MLDTSLHGSTARSEIEHAGGGGGGGGGGEMGGDSGWDAQLVLDCRAGMRNS